MFAGQLRYGELVIDYEVTANGRLSEKVRIHVDPGGRVLVEAPEDATTESVSAAVQRRARWITKRHLEAVAAKRLALPREYVSGETEFYLGRRYRLRVVHGRGVSSSVRMTGGCIEVASPTNDPAAVRRRLRDWFDVRAKAYLTDRLGRICEDISWVNTLPPVKFVRMERQWGSCSPDGAIHLNPKLIKTPRDCIDYVLIHELCHLREHNHSRRFYELLTRHSPSWERTKAKLDSMAEMILRD